MKAGKWLPGAVLAVCIARLWLMPLPSSFWVDEMGTMFVVRHGGGDPSFAAAPQVPESIYYWLPKAAEAVFGSSEIAYRVPSVLVLGLALVFIARLAVRLIHPGAGWLAVFVCLGLKGVNYAAADARPYALGMCVAGASLLMLARWMDSARWWDAAGFAICGALLWRVHLTFWPIYVVLAMYATVRLTRRDTKVGWLAAGAVFGLVGLALIPVLAEAFALMRQAKAHVVAPAPSVGELARALKIGLVAGCGAVAWALGRICGWRWNPAMAKGSTALVVGFWVGQPVCLFAFSWLTGDSVFVNRYLSVGLPGVALAATAAAGRFIPAEWWRLLSAAFGVGVLLLLGQWSKPWPPHSNSDWRGAARMVEFAGAEGERAGDLPESVYRSEAAGLEAGLPAAGIPVLPFGGVSDSREGLAVSLRDVAGGGDVCGEAGERGVFANRKICFVRRKRSGWFLAKVVRTAAGDGGMEQPASGELRRCGCCGV